MKLEFVHGKQAPTIYRTLLQTLIANVTVEYPPNPFETKERDHLYS
jgi:hypothetical protein